MTPFSIAEDGESPIYCQKVTSSQAATCCKESFRRFRSLTSDSSAILEFSGGRHFTVTYLEVQVCCQALLIIWSKQLEEFQFKRLCQRIHQVQADTPFSAFNLSKIRPVNLCLSCDVMQGLVLCDACQTNIPSKYCPKGTRSFRGTPSALFFPGEGVPRSTIHPSRVTTNINKVQSRKALVI